MTHARKYKEEQPVVAICYDFDKTLSPENMQEQGFIQAVEEQVPDFWKTTNRLAEDNEMDQNLAYMYMMKARAAGKVLFTKKQLMEYGAKVRLFPGVADWFERIRAYGRAKGVLVEHYIISSGLKEMIEGTEVARAGAFKKIYASSFYYDENGVAVWPAQVVNYTGKTQFLFRIEKGVLDINDPAVNDSFAPEDLRVPFRNMIYIGDSDTDIPCMKLVNANGGLSIGVYHPETMEKAKVYQMMQDNRIGYFAPADYRAGTQLDWLVKTIIDRVAVNETLLKFHYANQKETEQNRPAEGSHEAYKADLIAALERSNSFASTHEVVKKMRLIADWTQTEKEELAGIALENRQVRYIVDDVDVGFFFDQLLGENPSGPQAQRVKELLEKRRKIRKQKG